MKKHSILIVLFILLTNSFISAQSTLKSVFLEELTWTEVSAALKSGVETIIIPTGGTEQNGPHMVLGKHNVIVKHTAEQIAKRFENTIVAPVIAYVPEGDIESKEGHMNYSGTISLPEEYFIKLLEYTIRSFKAHGFKNIVLIGDSGGNQNGMDLISKSLNNQWKNSSTKVYYISNYYTDTKYYSWLKEQGETDETIGQHAGITDTSQLLAIDKKRIRFKNLERFYDLPLHEIDFLNTGEQSGVYGKSINAKVKYGKKILEFRINAALRQMKMLIQDKY